MTATPPPNVQAAAAVVNSWLNEQENKMLTDAEHAKLTPAQKLDYARRFDQSKMPANPCDRNRGSLERT